MIQIRSFDPSQISIQNPHSAMRSLSRFRMLMSLVSRLRATDSKQNLEHGRALEYAMKICPPNQRVRGLATTQIDDVSYQAERMEGIVELGGAEVAYRLLERVRGWNNLVE